MFSVVSKTKFERSRVKKTHSTSFLDRAIRQFCARTHSFSCSSTSEAKNTKNESLSAVLNRLSCVEQSRERLHPLNIGKVRGNTCLARVKFIYSKMQRSCSNIRNGITIVHLFETASRSFSNTKLHHDRSVIRNCIKIIQ